MLFSDRLWTDICLGLLAVQGLAHLFTHKHVALPALGHRARR